MHTTTVSLLLLALLASFASGLTLPSLPPHNLQPKSLKHALLAKGGSSGGGGRGGGGRGSSSSSSIRSGTGTGRGGSGDTGFRAVGSPNVNTNGRYANFFGGGGGKPFQLSSSSVFAGRSMGGGTRGQVPGTRTYGSGYPGGGRGVSGQYFPFGFWPIYWTGYGHSHEYGGGNATVEAQRPGGSQVMMELVAKAGTWNLTSVNVTSTNGTSTNATESYWIIGDNESVTALASVLADARTTKYGCGIDTRSIQPFNSTNSSQPHFQNVIQWYRASSFALASPIYNNTYVLSPLNETDVGFGWNASAPLPAFMQTQVDAYTSDTLPPTSFLACLNRTISAALPIIDGPPPLSDGAIVGIVIGSIVGAMLVFCVCLPCLWCQMRDMIRRRTSERKSRREEEERKKRWEQSIAKRTNYEYARVESRNNRHSASPSYSDTPLPYQTPTPGEMREQDRLHTPRVSISMPSPAYASYRHSRTPSSTSTARSSPLMRSTALPPTTPGIPDAEAYLSSALLSVGARRGGHASTLSVASITASTTTACDKSDTGHQDKLEKEDDGLLAHTPR